MTIKKMQMCQVMGFFEEKQNVTHIMVLFKIDYYIDKLMNVISVYCFV